MTVENTIIRVATAADLGPVYELICELEAERFPFAPFEGIFRRNLAAPAWQYWLAELDGNAAGFISLHVHELLHHCGPVGEIQEFVVRKNYRGHGIGRLLMETVLLDAVSNGILGVEVTTGKRRVENVSVYQRLGFELSHNKFTRALSPDY